MAHTSRPFHGRIRVLLLLVIVLLLGSASTILAANVTATWNHNTESDIAGYKLSYGTQTGVYTTTVDTGNVITWSLTLTAGQTYYFALQAYDTSGLISPLSAEVVYIVPNSTPPTITSLAPTSGPVGTAVTIAGTNFGATKGTSAVTFNGTAATPTTWSATTIGVPVPAGATTGNLVVTVGGVASTGVVFTVLPTPSVTSLAPTSGPVGTTVTIAGTNFGATRGTSTIAFNGTVATPTTWSATSIGVPVPAGATTGNIVVTVGGVASNGVTFTIATLTPNVTNLAPTSGPVGRLVTVTGTNFGATKGTSTVAFNGTAATPTTWSATSIVVSVPAGATTGSVLVTVGGVASAGVPFTVMPTPTVTSLAPSSGPVGTAMTIAGTNFSAVEGASSVTVNGTTATPTTWSATSIVIPVPAGASTGNVVVTVGGVPSTGVAFTVTTTTALAQVTTPAPESTLTASTVTVEWTGGTGVSQYWLYVGTTVGAADLFGQNLGASLSATVPGLPTNGSTLHVRLWSLIGGTWQFNDDTYTARATAATARAEVTTPAPRSTLTASAETFEWSGGTGVSQYWLYVGTTAGGFNLLNQNLGTSLSATVAGLPTDGSTVYVRLWSLIGGTWQYNDDTYTVPTTVTPARAEMTTPAPGSTLTSSAETFEWTGGTSVSQYWLYVGTTADGTDIFNQSTGTSLSATVPGLSTNGGTLYVRLWSLINGTWQHNDDTYTATTPGKSPARAEVTTPAPGSTLTASTVAVQWTGGTGVSQYWLYVGTTAGGTNLMNLNLGTSLGATVAGLPTNGSAVYVRLWSLIAGTWQYNDDVYASWASLTTARAEVTTPAPGSTLTASTTAVDWTGGTAVTQYWLYVGTTSGGTDIFNQSTGTSLSATVPGLPTNGGALYMRLWSLIGGAWQYNDDVFTAPMTTAARAEVTTPAPGLTLTASTVTVQWTGGTGVSKYRLSVGTVAGGTDLSDQIVGTSLSATVTGLPTSGSTLYLRLWSLIGGTWQFNDYTYTAATM
jgi:hypothetical protein